MDIGAWTFIILAHSQRNRFRQYTQRILTRLMVTYGDYMVKDGDQPHFLATVHVAVCVSTRDSPDRQFRLVQLGVPKTIWETPQSIGNTSC